MAMLRKIGRLFIIKTRLEAWAVIYVIALGAVERGQHYIQVYPGFAGYLLALVCTGVVFLAGAKLLDSVKPQPAVAIAGRNPPPALRHSGFSRSRPTIGRARSGSAERPSPGTGSRSTRSRPVRPEA